MVVEYLVYLRFIFYMFLISNYRLEYFGGIERESLKEKIYNNFDLA